jgi:hypothetical protein
MLPAGHSALGLFDMLGRKTATIFDRELRSAEQPFHCRIPAIELPLLGCCERPVIILHLAFETKPCNPECINFGKLKICGAGS